VTRERDIALPAPPATALDLTSPRRCPRGVACFPRPHRRSFRISRPKKMPASAVGAYQMIRRRNDPKEDSLVHARHFASNSREHNVARDGAGEGDRGDMPEPEQASYDAARAARRMHQWSARARGARLRQDAWRSRPPPRCRSPHSPHAARSAAAESTTPPRPERRYATPARDRKRLALLCAQGDSGSRSSSRRALRRADSHCFSAAGRHAHVRALRRVAGGEEAQGRTTSSLDLWHVA
jgi:hypothetical protein